MLDQKGISRREFVLGAGAAVASLPFLNLGELLAEDKKPNFVFILTDDQRWDAMSCAGHPFLRTPNIDRIANEGVRFTNAFVTTALCAPSRATFHTGMYVHSHGIKDNKTQWADKIPTYSELLRDAGYDTAFIGKWHMDGQDGPRPGFNRWVSFKGQGVYYNPTFNVDGEQVEKTGYTTDLLTKYAVDWLEQKRDKPFSLCLWHKACHEPFTPAVRHSRLYEDDPLPHPISIDDTLADKPSWLRDGKPKPVNANAKPGPKAGEVRKPRGENIRNYFRAIVSIDDSVGQVLRKLEDMGILDNTVVVFAGDNGYMWGEHGQGDKRCMYEESIRIPMVMRYPKLIEPGTVNDKMVLNTDICPTFLDIAGVPIPKQVEGKSWRPLLSGKTKDWRKDFLYEYDLETPYVQKPTVRGIRTEQWKYIEYPDFQGEVELYNIKNDPNEMHNLVKNPKYADTLAKMRARFAELMKSAGYSAAGK